jgi:hypothetical protein
MYAGEGWKREDLLYFFFSFFFRRGMMTSPCQASLCFSCFSGNGVFVFVCACFGSGVFADGLERISRLSLLPTTNRRSRERERFVSPTAFELLVAPSSLLYQLA